jgi:DNA repair protein RecO (recombination protein O)
MASYSIQGIVLRHADYRENDRMLTLLTPRGRVDALSRGCKRPKSPLLPCSEVFTLADYELMGSKGHSIITGCMLTDSFYPLRLDIDKLSCASYMANVCEATVQPEEDTRRPFLLLARALGCLCYREVSPRKVLSVFLLHYAVAMGYRPRLHHCVCCGQEIAADLPALFDIEQGGVLCGDCAAQSGRGAVLSPAERAWLSEALEKGVRGELPASDAPLALLQAYLECRLEKRIPPLLTPL